VKFLTTLLNSGNAQCSLTRAVAAEATYEWGANPGDLGDKVPQKLKAFRKICTKFGQI